MAEKKEVLVGGLGDKKPDSSFSSKSIQQGVSVEKEHSKNPKVRKEIAKDHLTEEPAYYDKLKQMENTPSFPGLDKLLNGFIEDNEQFLFGKDFGKGGGKSNYYQKPGITHISAEFRMTGQPKKADSVDLSEWFVDDEQAKSAGWVDSSSASPLNKQGAEEQEKKPKLGPLEHAYVADAVGASPHVRLSETLPGKIKPESGWYDRLLAAAAPLNKTYGERVQVGASRMADSPKLRLMSAFDPTANKDQAGLVELLAAGNWGQESDLLAKAREKYKNIIKPHQDKLLDPNGPVTSRETPWHMSMQAMLADKDTDIAGHTYLRKERPGHYWLNPMSKAGPLRELTDRMLRRGLSGIADHESTAGRFAASLVPFYPQIIGGTEAQNKLRRLAYKNKMYDPAAEPDVLEPVRKKADWWQDMKNRGLAFAGDVANQFEPSQFGRAANTFGSRMDRDGYLEAARAAHGQLSDPVRGLTGGGAGLLAGALLPAGVRGWAMPAAGGVGAAMAMANGPNGFEWKNMLTPKALAAGGLGALAGYLGNQPMGGDEEEETTDLLGRPVKRRSSGSNWLLPALGLGAAGLGGYALYNHFNPANKQAPPPPVSPAQATARGVGQGFAGVGNAVGKALGGNPLSQVGNTANSLLSAARGRLANIAAAQSAGSSIGQGIAGLGSAVGSAVSGLTTPAAPPANPTASAANLAGYGVNQAVTQGIPAIGNAAKAWANSGTPKPPAAPTSSILTPNQQGMVNSAISAPAPKAPPAVNIPPAVSQGISAARSMAGSVPSIPVDAVRGAAGAGAAAGRAAGGMMGRAPSGPVSMPSVPNVAPSIGRGLAGVRDALASTSSLSGMGNTLRDAAGGIKSMVTAPRLPAGLDKILARPNPTIPAVSDLLKRPAAPTFTPPKPAAPVNPTFIPPKPAPAVLPNTAVPIGQLKSSAPVPSTAAKPSLALNEQGPLAPNQRRGDYSLGNHGVRIWNGNNGAAPATPVKSGTLLKLSARRFVPLSVEEQIANEEARVRAADDRKRLAYHALTGGASGWIGSKAFHHFKETHPEMFSSPKLGPSASEYSPDAGFAVVPATPPAV